jgi:hypothetical protein
MSEDPRANQPRGTEEQTWDERAPERLPVGQIVFDDVFLLLMLGLVVPTAFYIIWGLWAAASVPVYVP